MFYRKNKNSKTSRTRSKRGFFVIELIVAIFIFSIVMTVSIGALIASLDANKKTQSLKSVLNNLNIVLDTMTKTLAVGTSYYCGNISGFPIPYDSNQDCSTGSDDSGLSFISNEDLGSDGKANDAITYMFVPPNGADSGYIARKIYNDDEVSPVVRMTAPEVNITEMKFFVTGTDPSTSGGDAVQPKVLVVVKGTAPAGPRSTPTDFMVQTLVTQRVPDF